MNKLPLCASVIRQTVGAAVLSLILAATLALQTAHAQTQTQPPARNAPARHGLASDIKAYITSPARWSGREWLKLGGNLAAVGIAYQYDDRVRAHFDTQVTGSSHKDYDLHDAAPAAAAFAGTWIYAALIHSEDGREEAASMLEAAAFGSAAAYAMKLVTGRERPYETGDPGRWSEGGASFPSIHVTAAFAIGTVLAESGNDHFRWVRRVLGYGIAAGTAYERLDHGDHWLSDTVAAAGLGVATAHFVMHRRYENDADRAVSLIPLHGGLALSYAVALRH